MLPVAMAQSSDDTRLYSVIFFILKLHTCYVLSAVLWMTSCFH